MELDPIYPVSTAPITDFKYTDTLVLGRTVKAFNRGDREACYVLMADYSVLLTIDGDPFYVCAPEGMTTDFASVPKIFHSIIGRVGPHLEACIIHDWLYVAWQVAGVEPTKKDHDFANRVLYAGLKSANCSWITRWGIWLAMEWRWPWVSWKVFEGEDDPIFMGLEVGELEAIEEGGWTG